MLRSRLELPGSLPSSGAPPENAAMERVSAALVAAARAQLDTALNKVPSKSRRLYVDDALFCARSNSCPLLSFFTSPDALRRSHGVTVVAPFSRAGPGPGSAVLLLRSGSAAALRAAAALAALASSPAAPTADVAAPAAGPTLVLVTPRHTHSVRRALSAAIVAGIVRIESLSLGFVPFDDSLVTLAWPRAFSEVVLEGNNAAILAAASAIDALSNALNADFSTVRTAGAAGVATVNKYLEISGRLIPARSARPARGGPRSPQPPGTSPISPSPVGLGRTPNLAFGSATGSAAASLAGSQAGSVVGSVADDGGASGDETSDGASEGEVSWPFPEISIANVLGGAHIDKGSNASVETLGGLDGDVGGSVARIRVRKKPVKLIVIDRNVDLVTPLLIQFTYEGLVDEAFGLLRGNVMDIGFDEFKSRDAAGMLGTDASSASKQNPRGRAGEVGSATAGAGATERANQRVQKRLRKDGDPVFGQLRDINYWAAARLISNVASAVRAYYDARPGQDSSEIGPMRDYVRGLREVKNEHQSAALHTAIAAEVSARTFEQVAFKRRFDLEREMVEGSSASGRRLPLHDAISRKEPLGHVLRLFCLWSLTSGGVDVEAFEFLRREIVATYGLSVLSLLGSLERAGLLTKSARAVNQGGMPWSPLVRFGFGNDSGGTGSGGTAGQGQNSGSGAGAQSMTASVVGYSWQFVRAAMRLLTEYQPESANSAALEAPYSGYVPLTVRLVDAGISHEGWSKLPRTAAHTLLLPPGHTTAERSVAAGTIAPDSSSGSFSVSSGMALGAASDVDAVVLFVGGIARAEASAVRAAAACVGQKVLIATTDVFGADQFVTMS